MKSSVSTTSQSAFLPSLFLPSTILKSSPLCLPSRAMSHPTTGGFFAFGRNTVLPASAPAPRPAVGPVPRLIVAGGATLADTRSGARGCGGQYGQASHDPSITWPFGHIRTGAFGFDFQNHPMQCPPRLLHLIEPEAVVVGLDLGRRGDVLDPNRIRRHELRRNAEQPVTPPGLPVRLFDLPGLVDLLVVGVDLGRETRVDHVDALHDHDVLGRLDALDEPLGVPAQVPSPSGLHARAVRVREFVVLRALTLGLDVFD